MKKVLTSFLIFASILCSLTGCGGAPTRTDNTTAAMGTVQDSIVWKIQSYASPGTLNNAYGEALINSINEMAGGRLVIEWYAADSIVSVSEVPTAVRDGILDGAWEYAGLWSSVNEAFPLFCSSPGRFSDPVDMVAWYYNGGGLELWNEAADEASMNCQLFLGGMVDMENFLWSNNPIVEIDDLYGISVRMMPIMGNILADNGVSVAFISGTELIASLERGVVDAAEWSNPAQDQPMGFEDVSKYCCRTGLHQPCAAQTLNINQQSWDALPDDLKAIVENACKANVAYMMADIISKNVDAMEYFESKGVTFTTLSEDAIATLQDWITAYYDKNATKGSLMKRIIDSQNNFIDYIAEFKDSRSMPYPDWAYGN